MASPIVDQILAAPWWPEFLRIKDTLSWAALGERFGVQGQNLARALDAAGGTKVLMPRGPKPRGAVAPDTSVPAQPTPEDILAARAGKAPDVEVAAAAGVPVEVVKQFRRDRGIAGYLRPPPDGFVPAVRTLALPPPLRKRSGVVVRRTAGEEAHEVRLETKLEPAVAASTATMPAEPVVAPSRNKERRPATDLEAFRSDLGKVGDHVIAELAGVSRRAVGDYRRELGIAAYDGFRWEKGKPKPPAKAPKAQGVAAVASPAEPAAVPARRGPVSPIDAFADMLGKVPDSVIAGLAAVRTDTVKHHRARRRIQAVGAVKEPEVAAPPESSPQPPAMVDRTPLSEPEEALPAPAEPPRADPASTAPPASRPRSRIDPFAHLVGVESDRRVAQKAGVGAGYVRIWRMKRNIPEAPLGVGLGSSEEAPKAPAPAPTEASAIAIRLPTVGREPTAAVEEEMVHSEPELPPVMGYRVRAVSGDRQRDFIVVADDITDATLKASAALSRRSDGPWRAAMIRELLEALE